MNESITLPAQVKRCPDCGELKPPDSFGVDRSHKDGRRTICRPCEADRKRKTYDPEKQREKYARYYAANAEKYRARARARAHKKRTGLSDITPEQEREMRRKARKCAMPDCGVWLTGKPGRPNSKHLDHILPINQGGTHTHGNVRIICRTCNLTRPKDGSDYAGQLTLWAELPGVAVRVTPARKPKPQPKTCRCGALFAAPGSTLMCPDCTDNAGRKAAELHASGMTWPKVAAIVGYGSHNGEGARYAAKRIGYTPEKLQAKPKTGRICGCGESAWRQGPCGHCTWLNAMFAVAMRHGEGWTLQMIADHLGYSSITTVTNLMRQVGVVDAKYSRPSRRSA